MLDEGRDEAQTESGTAGQREQSAEGLTEERLPQGGAKMDLKERFQQEQEGAATPAAPAAQGGGRIAILDPQTGRLLTGEAAALMQQMQRRGDLREDLRPDLQEFQSQLQDILARSQDVGGLEEQELESGAVKLDLEGRFQNPLVARITPEGDIKIWHATPAGN